MVTHAFEHCDHLGIYFSVKSPYRTGKGGSGGWGDSEMKKTSALSPMSSVLMCPQLWSSWRLVHKSSSVNVTATCRKSVSEETGLQEPREELDIVRTL